MTIQSALLSAYQKLALHSDTTSAHLDAEVLLSHVTKKPKGYLISHQQKKLTTNQYQKFTRLINRRVKQTPIAYLTNHKEFYGLDFFVNEHVLIPRPETELLIEESVAAVRNLQADDKSKKIILADIGTGSGCIAVTLAKYLPNIKVYATDVSDAALNVAKKNAQTHKVSSRITFTKGNMLLALKKTLQRVPLNIIVTNLPYLTKNELRNVPHEPRQALYGGKMGFEYIEKLIMQAAELDPVPVLLLEIAPTQVKIVDYIVERQLPEKKITFHKDLAGHNRVVKIK